MTDQAKCLQRSILRKLENSSHDYAVAYCIGPMTITRKLWIHDTDYLRVPSMIAVSNCKLYKCSNGSSEQTNSCCIPVIKGNAARGTEPSTMITRWTRANNGTIGTVTYKSNHTMSSSSIRLYLNLGISKEKKMLGTI